MTTIRDKVFAIGMTLNEKDIITLYAIKILICHCPLNDLTRFRTLGFHAMGNSAYVYLNSHLSAALHQPFQ